MDPRFDGSVLAKNGLACLFSNSSPERYKNLKYCCRENGWPNVGHLIEHIKRHHTPTRVCIYCGHRWPGTITNEQLPHARAAHIPDCEGKHHAIPRVPDLNEPEIMTESQERKLAEVKAIRRDNGRKLETLYRICGKSVPESYHVRPLCTYNDGSMASNDYAPDAPVSVDSGFHSGGTEEAKDVTTVNGVVADGGRQPIAYSHLASWINPENNVQNYQDHDNYEDDDDDVDLEELHWYWGFEG